MYKINQYIKYQGKLWVIVNIKENGDVVLSRYESYDDDTEEIIKVVKPDDLE